MTNDQPVLERTVLWKGKFLCADNNDGISRCARLAAFTPIRKGKGKVNPVSSGGHAV